MFKFLVSSETTSKCDSKFRIGIGTAEELPAFYSGV